MGGLTSREASRVYGGKGILTVGTPHTGAPIAVNYGLVADVGGAVMYTTSEAYYRYRYFATCFDCPTDWVARVATGYAYQANALGWFLTVAPGPAGFVAGWTSLDDLDPRSDVVRSLNSGENLAREASALRVRRSISTAAWDNWGIVWTGLAPDNWGYLTGLQYDAAAVFAGAFEYYYWYYDPYDPYSWEKTTGAYLWAEAATAMWAIDPAWCIIIGAWDGSGCLASDGIVPFERQRFPGAGAVNYVIAGVEHRKQPESDAVIELMRNVLASDFQVGRCADGAVTGLAIQPAGVLLYVGESRYFSVSGVNGCGQRTAVTADAWWSSNPGVVTIENGSIFAHAPGGATIYAAVGGTTLSAPVTVETWGNCDPWSVCPMSLPAPGSTPAARPTGARAPAPPTRAARP